MWQNPTASVVAPKVSSKIKIRVLDESITVYIKDVSVGTMAVSLKIVHFMKDCIVHVMCTILYRCRPFGTLRFHKISFHRRSFAIFFDTQTIVPNDFATLFLPWAPHNLLIIQFLKHPWIIHWSINHFDKHGATWRVRLTALSYWNWRACNLR